MAPLEHIFRWGSSYS